MYKLDQFKELASDFTTVADFITIYTEEAHPSNGWGFSSNFHQIEQHRTIQERQIAAKIIADSNPPFQVVLDDMNNEACYRYGAAPERIYVIFEGNIVFQGSRGPMDYDIDKARNWLAKYVNRLVI